MNYEAGRSDGCTSWSASDAAAIMAMVRNDPTTLYIYPESRDIDAVAAEIGLAPVHRRDAHFDLRMERGEAAEARHQPPGRDRKSVV